MRARNSREKGTRRLFIFPYCERTGDVLGFVIVNEEELKQGAAGEKAAGMPAVISSLQHVGKRSGLLKGTEGLLRMNQKGGFDCPSCAWPDPDDHRAMTEFCENGAKALASEAMKKTIGRDFFARYSVAELLEKSDRWHDAQGRLAEPMVLREGSTHYEPISWEEAFQFVGEHLRKLDSPNEAAFYTSGRASNEAAFLYQLFVRAYGTNNLPDCSNMCHESSGSALNAAIGVGKGTVTLDDIHGAETIICVGQNPGTNHPRMLSSLEEAVKNGAEVVAINPLKEPGLLAFAHPQKPSGLMGKATPLASQYLQVRVNGDLALFRGLAKEVLSFGAVDEKFVCEHCEGYEVYAKLLESSEWEAIEEMSGISKKEIQELAKTVVRGEKKLITCWAMGVTQHRNAVATIREITNLHLMLGAIGRPNAGLCPVRGHSNVQGDRTVGIFEKMPEWFLAALDEATGIRSPREIGHDTVNAIQAMAREEVKVFVALGGNFVQASPDTDYTAKALEKCALTCQVSTKLNRSHLLTGKTALILPCLGRSEADVRGQKAQIVSCENSMGVVQSSEGSLDPASPYLQSETAIVAGLASATVGNLPKVKWGEVSQDYDKIREMIEKVVPGFENYNERVRKPGGFYLPNGAKERKWNNGRGKALFSDAEMDCFEVEKGRLILQTLRSHDQFNTTVYGLEDRYRGLSGDRRLVLMSPQDAKDRGIKPMQKVRVKSFWKGEEREVADFRAVPYDMPQGCVAAYFPEANVLVPVDSTALESNTPTSKAVEVEITAQS